MKQSRLPCMLTLCGAVLLSAACDRSPSTRTTEPTKRPRTEPVLRPDDNPKTIVNKAVKAHGGEKAFTRWSCGRIKYKAEGSIVPSPLGNATMEDTFQLPGHFKRVARMTAIGKEFVMVFVLNHGKGWTKKGDGEPVPEENAFTDRTEHPFGPSISLLPFLDNQLRLTRPLGGATDGQGRIGVRAEGEGIEPVDLYFDAQTGLLQLARTNREPPAITDTILEDYREIQEGMVPMQVKGVRAGKLIWHATLLEVEFRDKYEGGVFAKP